MMARLSAKCAIARCLYRVQRKLGHGRRMAARIAMQAFIPG